MTDAKAIRGKSEILLATCFAKGKRFGYRSRIGKNNPTKDSGCDITFGIRPLCCPNNQNQKGLSSKKGILPVWENAGNALASTPVMIGPNSEELNA